MTSISSDATAALATLQGLGFDILDLGGWRLGRPVNGGESWSLGCYTDDWFVAFNSACIDGLALAQSILADESARLALGHPVVGAPGSYQPSHG